MENDALADQILAALEQLLQAAGPEWTLQFLNAGMEEVMGMTQEQPQMENQSAMRPPSMGNNMRRM
jgi:hypothetical protein